MMRVSLLFVLVIHSAHCSCPTGLDLVNTTNGQECRGKYARVHAARQDVVSKCDEILGTPIIIHNEKDNQYWANRVSDTRDDWIMMGLFCNTTTKVWHWVDGTPLDYKPRVYAESCFDSPCDKDYIGVIDPGYGYGDWSCGLAEWVESFDVYCSTPVRQPLPSVDGCDNFEENSEDGLCYQVAATSNTWKNAAQLCGSFGATVASVHNAQENSFIRRLAVSKGAVGGVFLGAAPSGNGSAFEWTDGSEWDYDNYYPGFPSFGFGDCLMMDTAITTGDWANVDCSTELSVACVRERNTNYTIPCSTGPWNEGQIIFSPGFPYDASISCDYILSVDSGKKVELEVLFLEANPCCDHLLVYENYYGANLIANLTGQISDNNYTTSSSNFMRVSWQPNGGMNVRGVMMTFRGV